MLLGQHNITITVIKMCIRDSNITAEQYLTMTEKNLNTLGQDTQYQQMIHDHKLSMDDYVNWLTNQNYQCQKINS